MNMKDCPVMYPSKYQFRRPLQFLETVYHELEFAGMCRVVPSSVPSKEIKISDDAKVAISERIVIPCGSHLKIECPSAERPATHKEFLDLVDCHPRHQVKTVSEEEIDFWNQHSEKQTSWFGRFENGEAIDSSLWGTLQSIAKAKQSLFRHLAEGDGGGVSIPTLYTCSRCTIIPWTTQAYESQGADQSVSRIPKVWYSIPAKHRDLFHQFVARLLPEINSGSYLNRDLLQTLVIPPSSLMDAGIQVFRTIQNMGELVFTAPGCFHCWISLGRSVGGSVNFALKHWVPLGFSSMTNFSLLPFEEILVHDALAVGEALEKNELPPNDGQIIIIEYYNILIDTNRRLQCEMRKRGCKLASIDWPYGSSPCSDCSYNCFLSMTLLGSSLYPVCLKCALKKDNEVLRGAVVATRRRQEIFEALAIKLWRHRLRIERPIRQFLQKWEGSNES